ncbi:hypothetical protein AB0919_35035 [Streptomyces sp. NPDC046994]
MTKGMGRRPKVDLDSGVEDVTLSILERLDEQGLGQQDREWAPKRLGQP